MESFLPSIDINEAAKATRKFALISMFGDKSAHVSEKSFHMCIDVSNMEEFTEHRKAHDVCDKMNLVAVLEVIRQCSPEFISEMLGKEAWVNAIDALINEVRNTIPYKEEMVVKEDLEASRITLDKERKKFPEFSWRTVNCYERLYLGDLQVGFAVRLMNSAGWRSAILTDEGPIWINEPNPERDRKAAHAETISKVKELLGWKD